MEYLQRFAGVLGWAVIAYTACIVFALGVDWVVRRFSVRFDDK